LHGGERISALQTNYPDQDRDSYVPDASNIAPRRKGWKPKKSNTQMPPIKGKVRKKPAPKRQRLRHRHDPIPP